jgi:hypothetical protein
MEPLPSPLLSRAKPRDLQFRGPFLEMFFDRNANEVEGSAAPLWAETNFIYGGEDLHHSI